MAEIVTTADDAILQNNINSLKSYDIHTGRPPRYSDDEAGLEQFKADTVSYFETVRSVNAGLDANEKRLIVTIENWCTSLGLTRQSLSRYRSRGQEWQSFIDFTREVILSNKLQRYYTGAVPPVSVVFDLVNNHNYSNTNEAGRRTDTIIDAQQKTEYPVLIERGETDAG